MNRLRPLRSADADAPRLDAIVLAGGRASRLGGIDKPALVIRGARLVDHAVDGASAAGADQVILVGPHRTPTTAPVRLVEVREDPPFGGPVAALEAGLAQVTAPLVLLLAADLPYAELAASTLLASVDELTRVTPAAAAMTDGVVLVDEEGRDQWLAGVYLVGPLRSAIARLNGRTANASLRLLVQGLRIHRTKAEGSAVDIDTYADAESWGAALVHDPAARPRSAAAPTNHAGSHR